MFERRRAYNEEIKWSKADESKLLAHLRRGAFDKFALQVMFPNRSLASIRSKTRRVRIKHDLFGESYREAKKLFTQKHARVIRPTTVFEGYCGAGHQTSVWIKYCKSVYASDKSAIKAKQFERAFLKGGFARAKHETEWKLFSKDEKNIYFFHGAIIDAAVELRTNNVKIDILDLDTCGSTLPVLPLLLTLVKPKYLAITHGEFHSKRFGRDDVLRRLLSHRNINETSMDFTPDQLASELDKAVKIAALRSHNETQHSYWLELIAEEWLGSKFHGMLRRIYKVARPPATADCLNLLTSTESCTKETK